MKKLLLILQQFGFLFSRIPFPRSFMVCIILFVSGLQLLCIGLLSQHLAKTYLEVKQRPIYILKEGSREKEVKNKDK